MNFEVINEKYGKITYDESVWTGKKTISINGVTLGKVGKTNYVYINGEEKMDVQLKGNFLTGCSVTIEGNTIKVVPNSSWYEYLFALLPILLVIIWGNSVALCKIIPIVGGAIGGAIAGVFGAISLVGMKSTKKVINKVLIGIGCFAAAFVICFLVALIILGLAAK